ncbi:MAG TPA: phosphodiester glycosidase family protein [Mycobacteriales bacterium]|nr:phosphodiester glycosidase family protein [Mycobacteriales bacterium]
MVAQRNKISKSLRGVAAVSAAVVGMGLSLAPSAHAAGSKWHRSCPLAESLVPGTTWHTHKLAPGVTLLEGNTTDDNGHGLVKMHVLRIAVDQPGVSFQPLMHALAQRTPLSRLAAGHKHLVAAVNTGYFDFETGAPTQPLIVNSQPLVISSKAQRVLGFNAAGGLQTGLVHLSAKVVAGSSTHSIAGINVDYASSGVEAYNSAWGSHALPSTGWSAAARSVVGSSLGANAGRDARVPQSGFALTAHGRTATQWLSGLPSGVKTGVAASVGTTTARPFVQAYGVGAQVVEQRGHVRNDLSCNSANTTQPARTAYGIADSGKTLVIGEVEDHPGTNVHGLDENQMSAFMAQLGVDRAFDVDGSGSTEMLAKLPSSGALSLRTYPADGQERPMPVGLGISYVKPKVVHHKHHHKS